MLEWYAWLSQLNAALSEPLTAWSQRLNIPVLTALLLGLLGSTAPCQLTTNASAMALLAQRMADVKGAWKTALPLLSSTYVVSLGATLAPGYVTRMKGLDRYLRRIAAVIFLMAGLHDTLT
jgi:cytochrome c biogenesis protein CcdA